MIWQPIEDYASDWKSLANTELPPLVTVWDEQAGRLRDSGEFQTYMERLRREIAIETGIIERLYTLDRGVTRLLIEQGISESLIPHGSTDRPIKQIVALIQDQESAIDGLFDFVGGQRQLSTSYIKQLHQALTQNQEYTEALVPSTGAIIQVKMLRGTWKMHPNNPQRADGSIHQYCPPEHVASEMDRLIDLHLSHLEQGVAPEVEAAWLHHRFTQIHPFQDGNGRVARCLASLVFIQAGWFPLAITRDDRKVYIDALEQADKGDLSDLINLFSNREKQAFIRSLGLSEQVMAEARRAQTIISSIADRLRENKEASIRERQGQVEEYASKLFTLTENRVNEIAEDIRLSIQNVVNGAQIFTVASPVGDKRSYYHRYQVIETARQLEYFANLRNYHSWIQLVVNVERPTFILISFHVLGREHRGLMVSSACAYHKDDSDEGEHNISDIQSLSGSPFQFSYADDEKNLSERFSHWLEDVILAGLDYWNKGI